MDEWSHIQEPIEEEIEVDEESDMIGIEDEAHTFDGALKAAVVGHYGLHEEEEELEDWD